METQVRKPLALIALLFAVGCAVRPPSPVDSDAGSIGAESLAHVVGAAGPIGPYPLNLLAKCDAGEIVGMLGGVQGCVYQAQLDGGAILGVTGTAPVAVSAGAHPVVSLNGIDGGGQYAYAADGGWRGVVGVQSVAGSAPISCSGNPTATCSISAATDIAAGSLSASDKTKLDGITAGAAVASVGATAPITSTGGTTPTIAIVASTDSVAGSMSAADKTKLDGITAGAAVATVTGSAPIVSSGGTSPAISITGATTSAVGSIKLANDFASSSTATTPVIGSLQSGEVTCGASTGMLTAASGASSPGITGNANNGLTLISPSNVSSFTLESGGTTTDQLFSFSGAFTGKTYLNVGLGGASSTNLLCSGGTGFTGQCGLSFGPTGSVVGTTNSVLIEGQPNSGEPGTAGPAILLGGPETSTGPGANVAGWSGVVGGLATSCSTGTCTGGDAYVYGGTGTTANGVAHFGLGGTAAGASGGSISGIDVFRINPPTGNETTGEVDFPTGSNLYIGSTNAAVANGTNVIGIATGTAPSSCAASGCIFASTAGTTIMNHDNSTTQIGESGIVFGAANGTTQLVQTTGTTGTGSGMIVAGQSMSGAGATAGSATFSAGSATGTTGTTTGGNVTLSAGIAVATSGAGNGGSVTIHGGAGINGGAPGSVSIYSGAGGTAAGGNISLIADGTAANNGFVALYAQAAKTMQVNGGEVDVLNGENLCIGSTNAAVANGTNVIGIATGTAPSSCSQNACLYSTASGLGLMDSSNNALAINGTAQTWANGSNAVTVGTSGTGTFNLNTGNGTGGASTSSSAGSLTFTTGLGGTPASGTGNGSHGGDWSPTTGNGGNGLGTSGNGGRGGQMNVNTGNGGNGVGTAGAGGAGGNIALNAGNGGTSTGSANNANGGTVYIDSGAPGTGGGGTAGVAGPIIFQENGTSIMELKASATNTAAAEFGIANGYNFTMGSITGAQSTGTNILGMKAGSAASTCNTDVCIEEITAGTGPGIWALFGAGGMLSQLASDVTGTHNSEQIEIVKSATQKRTTGVSQTVTSTMALNSAVGVSVDAICMARTITAGTAGAIGDMGKIHVEGLVTNPAGTSSLVGTTATIATQGAAASNPVASCVISGNASGQVIVTATGASNGAGLVLDWGIFVTLEQL